MGARQRVVGPVERWRTARVLANLPVTARPHSTGFGDHEPPTSHPCLRGDRCRRSANFPPWSRLVLPLLCDAALVIDWTAEQRVYEARPRREIAGGGWA